MIPLRPERGIGINHSGVSLWSMASFSCGVAREKGLFGICFDKSTDTAPFTRILHRLWTFCSFIFVVNFIYFDQGRRSCPGASCILYNCVHTLQKIWIFFHVKRFVCLSSFFCFDQSRHSCQVASCIVYGLKKQVWHTPASDCRTVGRFCLFRLLMEPYMMLLFKKSWTTMTTTTTDSELVYGWRCKRKHVAFCRNSSWRWKNIYRCENCFLNTLLELSKRWNIDVFAIGP